MQVSINIFDIPANPILAFILLAIVAAHILAVIGSLASISILIWSALTKNNWWGVKTWVAASAGAMYLGVSFFLLG